MLIIAAIILITIALVLMVNVRGIPSYTGSTITISVGGTYIGGGISGWSGGANITITPTERSYEIIRKWVEATCDQYQQGYSGPIGVDLSFEGHWRNNGDPPTNFLTDEMIYVSTFGIGSRNLAGVFFAERFQARGSISQGTSKYTLKGKSDGAVSIS
jgi:hypothetical protein